MHSASWCRVDFEVLSGKSPPALAAPLQVFKRPDWPLKHFEDGLFLQLDSIKTKQLHFYPYSGGLLRRVDMLHAPVRPHANQSACAALMSAVNWCEQGLIPTKACCVACSREPVQLKLDLKLLEPLFR